MKSSQTCKGCGEVKDLSAFNFRKDRGIYRPVCNKCRADTVAAQRYNVTVGDIESLREKQANRCAICGIHADDVKHASFTYNPLVIDHCHSSGKVRGLLCPPCNILLGHAKDSPKILLEAVQYLLSR